MKRILIILPVVSLLFVSLFCSSGTKTPEAMYKTGDIGPGGGWIFYDKGKYSDGWRYLEVSPSEQAYILKWGCMGIVIKDARHTRAGTGKTNTLAIIKKCDQPIIAANIALVYTGGDKSDWYLPSIDELKLMHENLYMQGIGDFDENTPYWSSSEEDGDNAIGFYFKHGGENAVVFFIKKEGVEGDVSPHVRAVRQF